MKRRLLGEHFKRNGQPKRPFTERSDAVAEAIRSSKAHVYRCKFCGQWHVGG